MPKVPTYQAGLRTRPVTTDYERGDHRSGLHDLARGAGQLSQGLQQLDAAQQRTRERAREVDVADNLTAFQSEANAALHGDSLAYKKDGVTTGQWGLDLAQKDEKQMPRGFLAEKGKAAAEKSSQVRAAIERRRKELAEKIADPQTREEFLSRSGAILNDTTKRVELHVNEQIQAAGEVALKDRLAVGVQSIASNYRDRTAVAEQVTHMDETIQKLAPSEEVARAQMNAWRQTAASTVLDQYLGAGDFRGAEQAFAELEPFLGERAAKYRQSISAVKEDREAEGHAAAIAEEATFDDGDFDTEWAIAEVDKLPEGPLRDEVRKRVEHRAMVAEGNWKQTIHSKFSTAFTSYLKGGRTTAAVDPLVKSWLIENAPEEWNKLEMMERHDRDHARAQSRRGAGVKDPRLEAKQRAAYVRFQADVAQNPDRYAGMTPEAFTAEWGPELREEDFRAAGGTYAATKKADQLGLSEFSGAIREDIKANPALKDKEKAAKYSAFMGNRYREYIDTNKKKPDAEQIAKWRNEALAKTVETFLGIDFLAPDKYAFEATEEEPEAAAATPPAPASSPPQAKPTMDAGARARELKRQGLTREQISEKLTAEGY